MKNYRRIAMLMCSVGLMLLLTGVTYSFFNYTKTGNANVFSTGDISFNTDEGESITLTNVFPMSESEASAANLDTLTIGISGSTTYASGEEFLISIVDVTKVNNKEIPMSYIATYEATTGNSIGIEEADYFTERESKSDNIYLLNENGRVKEDKQVLVGFIKGGTAGIDGTLTIKPYVDAERIIITDTPETIPDLTIGKTVISTTEWNSLKGNNAISFKIKAESYMKLWVEEPEPDNVTPETCFDKQIIKMYTVNSNMTQTELNDCISYINDFISNHGYTIYSTPYSVTGTAEDFCLGRAIINYTFQQTIDRDDNNEIFDYEYLESHNVVSSMTGLRLISYDNNCGSDIVIPNKMNYTKMLHNTDITSSEINTCVDYFANTINWTVDTSNGETMEKFCDGTGTVWGYTFQQYLDEDYFNESQIVYLKNQNIILEGTTTKYNVLAIGAGGIIAPFIWGGNMTSLKFNNSLLLIGNEAILPFIMDTYPDIVIPASVRHIGDQAFEFPGNVTNRQLFQGTSFTILGRPYIGNYALPAYETIRYGGTCQELYGIYDSGNLIYDNDDYDYDDTWDIITTDTNSCPVGDGYL